MDEEADDYEYKSDMMKGASPQHLDRGSADKNVPEGTSGVHHSSPDDFATGKYFSVGRQSGDSYVSEPKGWDEDGEFSPVARTIKPS